MNKIACLLQIFANYYQQNCAFPSLLSPLRYAETDCDGNVTAGVLEEGGGWSDLGQG